MDSLQSTPATYSNSSLRPINVLAIDGGGIRGIIPASMLEIIEQFTGRPLTDTFDLVAGTSTGSLVGAAILRADPKNPTKPELSASKVTELMVTKGPIVFHNSFLHEVVSVDGLISPKYKTTGFDEVITSLGDDKVSNLLTNAWFPSTEKNNLSPFYFTRREARRNPDWKDIMVSQMLKYTTAAPYYFSAAEGVIGNKQYVFMDGGLFANCPAINAINEANELFGCGYNNQLVLSLGTGFKVYDYSASKNMNQGLDKVLPWIITATINANASASLTMSKQALGNRFMRFNPQIDKDSLDDASAKNIAYLVESVSKYKDENFDLLEESARRLKERMVGEKPGAIPETYS